MRLALFVVALTAACVAALYVLLDIAPPERLRMAAGREGGGYHAIATRYREILARDGVELEVVETAGSGENARLIAAGEVETAILQGGVSMPEGAPVEALAALFVEPVFVFHRLTDLDAVDPSAWRGLRVAAGEPGGGTRIAVETIVEALGLEAGDEALLPIGGRAAADALLAGDVDVAVFVAPIEAPYLERLLGAPGVRLAPIRDAEALARRLTFVRMVDIPPAGIDYAARIPESRIPLAGMVARLVAVEGLHPALVDRLVEAARVIHSEPSLLSRDAIFPSTIGLTLPINQQAEAKLRDGPSALDRWLPYWISAQINRVALLLLPIIVVLPPLLRAAPALYAWRMNRRVWRRYDELMAIDRESEGDVSSARRADLLDRLDAIDREASRMNLPARYRVNAYTLRLHIDLVRGKLRGAGGQPAAARGRTAAVAG